MLPLQYPLINGFLLSWSSIEIAVGPLQAVVLTKSIKYKDARTLGKVYGTSPMKVGRTRGQLDPTGSWEVYRSAWDQIVRDILVAGLGGGVGFGENAITIFVKYAEPSNPTMIVTDILSGVICHSPEGGGSEGTDALTIPFELDIMKIQWGQCSSGASITQLSSQGKAIPGVAVVHTFG
jgi:hypothetical protein